MPLRDGQARRSFPLLVLAAGLGLGLAAPSAAADRGRIFGGVAGTLSPGHRGGASARAPDPAGGARQVHLEPHGERGNHDGLGCTRFCRR